MSASSAHKVLDILLLFTGGQPRYSVEEIKQQTDIPTSTVYRYVRVLCDRGLLEKSSDGTYHVGLRLLELNRAARRSNRDLRLMLLPGMQRIAAQIIETVTLMRLSTRHAMCIESIEGQQVVRVTIEQGRMQPLYAGASSRVLLAGMDESEWDNYLDHTLTALTPNTITNRERLKTEIQRTREQGYAISSGEIDDGGRAIAVPVINRHDRVVAALSIEGPAFRMTDAMMSRYLELLRHEVEMIQSNLG